MENIHIKNSLAKVKRGYKIVVLIETVESSDLFIEHQVLFIPKDFPCGRYLRYKFQ